MNPEIEKARRYSEQYGTSFSFISTRENRTKSTDGDPLIPQWELATVVKPGNGYINVEVPFSEPIIQKATITNRTQNEVKEVKVSSRLIVSEKGGHTHQFIITKLWLDGQTNKEQRFNDIHCNTITFIYDIYGKLVNQYETRGGKMYSLMLQPDSVTKKDQIKYTITLGNENFTVVSTSNTRLTKSTFPIYRNCPYCHFTTYNFVCPGCGYFDHINGNYDYFFHNMTEYIKSSSDDIMGSMILCTYGFCNEKIRVSAINKAIVSTVFISSTGISTFEYYSEKYTRWSISSATESLFFSEGFWIYENDVDIYKSYFMDLSLEMFYYNSFYVNLSMSFSSFFGCDCDEIDPDNNDPNNNPNKDKIARELCERCYGCINHNEHASEIYCPKKCPGNCCNHVEKCEYCKLCIHQADDLYDEGCNNPCPSPDLHYKMLNLPIHAPKAYSFVNIESKLTYKQWLAIEEVIKDNHFISVIADVIFESQGKDAIKINVGRISGGFYGSYLNGTITISDAGYSSCLESTLREELFHCLQHLAYGSDFGAYYEVELEYEACVGFIDYRNGCMIGPMANEDVFINWFNNLANHAGGTMGEYNYEALLKAFISIKGADDILTRSGKECYTVFDVFNIIRDRL